MKYKKITPYFAMIILLAFAATAADGFQIDSPEETTYNHTNIILSISSNETLDSISYMVDENSLVQACNNCSNYDETLNLSEGNHTIYAETIMGNTSFNDTVTFSIVLPVPANDSEPVMNNTNTTNNNTSNQTQTDQTSNHSAFSISITSPEAKTYMNGSETILLVESNQTIDSITASVGSNNFSCTNCSIINQTLNLGVGTYTAYAQGMLGNNTRNDSVTFTISAATTNTSTNNTNTSGNNTTTPNNNTTPRFTLGFNKLPQAVEESNISDSELAEIIRNNKLNPGILNRLIKTGKLGNESLSAIVDTQFNPPGIFRKLIGFFGIKTKSYSDLIVENYNLTEELEIKVSERSDIGKKNAEAVQSSIAAKREKKENPSQSANKETGKPETTGKPENPGNSGKTTGTSDADLSGKSNGKDNNPGQDKKEQNGNGNNGQGNKPK